MRTSSSFVRLLQLPLTFAALAALVCLTHGCPEATAQMPIEGLKLPEGAQVVQRQEDEDWVMVMFDLPQDWPAVKAHFDAELAGLGYAEEDNRQELAEIIRTNHPDWDEARVEAHVERTKTRSDKAALELGSSLAAYIKPDSPYRVTLLEMKSAKQHFASLDQEARGQAGVLGDYMLSVGSKDSEPAKAE